MKRTQNFPAEAGAATPGDEQQRFQLLFKHHASGLYYLAYNHLRVGAEAQEIVQDCFLKLWEKRREIGLDATAAKGYLYTSAYHAILNQMRHRRYWVYEDCPDDLVVEQEPQSSDLAYEQLQDLYSAALAQLPVKRRQIFAMSRQQGFSNARIAQELNISIKTVENQMTQALRFLRHYFVAHGILLDFLLLLVAVAAD